MKSDSAHNRFSWAHTLRDGIALTASIGLAVVIVRSDAVHTIADALGEWRILGVFVAGFFFTSIATVAPAGVVLAEYASFLSPLPVALVGALGSVIADLILFRITRGHVARDLRALFAYRKSARLRALIRSRPVRYLLPLLGGLIIASPLPDELGVTLLGLSRASTSRFLAIAYGCNAIGIYVISLVAQTIS